MYKFYDKESDDIIKKYNLTEYVILFENKDCSIYEQGLNELSIHTCKVLEELSKLDDYGSFLLTESIRYLVNVYKHQKYPNRLHEKYYTSVLKQFHKLGYLLFKEEVKPYRLYKKKKFTFKINYKLNNENITMVYYSLKNMTIDYGRYRVDKLTQMYEKQSSLDYDFIQKINPSYIH